MTSRLAVRAVALASGFVLSVCSTDLPPSDVDAGYLEVIDASEARDGGEGMDASEARDAADGAEGPDATIDAGPEVDADAGSDAGQDGSSSALLDLPCGEVGKEISGAVRLTPANCQLQGGIRISTSNTHLDCNGATFAPPDASVPAEPGLLIQTGTEGRLEQVTVENCTFSDFKRNGVLITGDVRFKPAHDALTLEQRYARAPKEVTLRNVKVLRSRWSGIYVDAYNTGNVLDGVHVEGAGGGGIYLEFGSRGTVLENSQLLGNGTGGDPTRPAAELAPALSIDSSAGNRIENNRFVGNAGGAIRLYKNCGENGLALPPNTAPVVSAGPNLLASPGVEVALVGSVSDGSDPTKVKWTKVRGSGVVTFSPDDAVSTSARFPAAGTYVVQLTATDSLLSASSQAVVVVGTDPTLVPADRPPTVRAEAETVLGLDEVAHLDGLADDDGLPGSSLSSTWAKVPGRGPDVVAFADANAVQTTASFATAGVYVLRLTVSDGALSAFADLSISVVGENSAIRVQPSDGNVIRNNLFEDEPIGVWIASRQSANKPYCADPAYSCATPAVGTAGPYDRPQLHRDYAKRNSVHANLFRNVDQGVIVEDDENTVIGNSFEGDATRLISVGTACRSALLGEPVRNTVVWDNRSTVSPSAGIGDLFWIVYGSQETASSGNTHQGAPLLPTVSPSTAPGCGCP